MQNFIKIASSSAAILFTSFVDPPPPTHTHTLKYARTFFTAFIAFQVFTGSFYQNTGSQPSNENVHCNGNHHFYS